MRPTKADQSVAPNSLAEVLKIDDDDANLNNGTPNFSTIGSIFENRNITNLLIPCGDSAGHTLHAMPDCDNSSSLDILDYLCFSSLFAANDTAADLDDNGVLNTHDYAMFQSLYENKARISKETHR